MIFFKSVNIWESYEQQGDCLVHFARLATTLLNDEESARNNHVLACTFAKYSLILTFFQLTDSAMLTLRCGTLAKVSS